jgi:hypothetical protein
MSQTLSGYITECRRLLHDANGNFYSDNELTDYIILGKHSRSNALLALDAIQRTTALLAKLHWSTDCLLHVRANQPIHWPGSRSNVHDGMRYGHPPDTAS